VSDIKIRVHFTMWHYQDDLHYNTTKQRHKRDTTKHNDRNHSNSGTNICHILELLIETQTVKTSFDKECKLLLTKRT